ncbi:MAG TPA: response regulator, partial [Rhodospirillales bacterium]|nr:response regulator [Rhodospirillales bacterium]
LAAVASDDVGFTQALPETINIPVIFLTAKSQPHEVAEYIRLDAIDVISKPFDPVELCEKIEAIWKHHHD